MRTEPSLFFSARTSAVNWPVTAQSTALPPFGVIDVREHCGALSTLSVALTATLTATIFPFGGQTASGVASRLTMTGAAVSASTTTLVEDDGDTLPAASEHVTLSVYVLPPTARTRADNPVNVKSSVVVPLAVIEDSVQTGAASTSSVAMTTTATSTSWPFGGQTVEGV